MNGVASPRAKIHDAWAAMAACAAADDADDGPLPKADPGKLAMAAGYMLDELREQRLVVVKIGTLRVAVEHNPKWYSEVCDTYKQRRRRYPRPRTIIKRCHVVRTLEKIASGTWRRTLYMERLEAAVERYARGL